MPPNTALRSLRPVRRKLTLELQGHGEQRFARIEENWQLLCADAVVEGPLAPRLCGGFRFDPRGPREEHWQAFADASLMLAGITVLREGERYRVLCQHLAKPGEDALALAAYHCSALLRLRQPARRRPSGPTAGAQGDASAQERRQWEAKVSDAVSSVRQGRFGKVVLARTQARPLGDIEPWQVIEHLRLQHADAQLFACRRGNACFLGASPERLVRIRAGEALTHAHLVRDGGEHRQPAYLALNPQGRVPALQVDEGELLIQSPAIIEYLEERYPQPALLSSDPLRRARERGVAALVGCDIHPLHNASVLNLLRQWGHDEEQVRQWIGHWVGQGLAAVEQLIGDQGWCFGDRPGLADVYLVPQLYAAERFGVALDAWPRIRRVADLAAAHPAFRQAHPANQPDTPAA